MGNNQKKNAGLYVILLLFLIYVGLAVGRVDFHQVTIENFEETIILALTDPWSAPLITKNSVLLTVFLSFLWGLFFLYKMADTRIFMPGREFGTSRLLTAKELNRYTCNFQQPEKNKILSQTARLQYDMQNVNANSVIIGGSGSGKSFYEVKPNLYQCGTSFVVTDPNRSMTIERLKRLAANTQRLSGKKRYYSLALKLSDADDQWYRELFHSICSEFRVKYPIAGRRCT